MRLTTRLFLILVAASTAFVAIPAVLPLLAQEQPPQKPLAFEVASIKARPAGDSVAGRTQWDLPDGFRATNTTLQLLIGQAYHILPFRMSGGADWIARERFDVVATAGRRLTDEEKHAMVRALLEDRFKLRVHHETRDSRLYALVRVHGDSLGPDLKVSDCAERCGIIGSFSGVIGHGVEMTAFAQRLEPLMRTTIIDETHLHGRFDLRLRMNPESVPATPSPFATDDGTPSLFTALEEQLGLKLEPRRGHVEMFVIDHVERPTAD